jgi:hypothetical protein
MESQVEKLVILIKQLESRIKYLENKEHNNKLAKRDRFRQYHLIDYTIAL